MEIRRSLCVFLSFVFIIETNKYDSLYWENKQILKCRLPFQLFLMQSDFSSGGSGQTGANSWSPEFLCLLILDHLIWDHLQPCDEVPVDDCATLAFVLKKPFTVVSDIIPLAVLLALKNVVIKGGIVGNCLSIFLEGIVTLYSHWGRSPRGDLKPKGVFIFSSFPLLQILKMAFSDMFVVARNNLHCQSAWEFCLDILVADQLASRQAVFPLWSQLCNILPLLGLCRPPLPSSFSSHH